MPLYTYKCCVTKDHYSTIAARHHGPDCPECGETMRFVIVPPMVQVSSFDGYKCPITNEIVTTERQRREIMARHDLVDANDFKPKRAEAS